MGSAVDLDMAERLLEVEMPRDQGDGTTRCYVPCEDAFSATPCLHLKMGIDDKLVIAVGSASNDHGVKGLEHCFQLKTVPDAQAIRRRIMSETSTIRSSL